MKDIKDYLHLYLGHDVYVQKKQGKEALVKGRICEITSGSNHGDWIMVQFDEVVEFMYYNFDERRSNFHTFFIGEDHIKLSLRPLSDMTEGEAIYIKKLLRDNHGIGTIKTVLQNGWHLGHIGANASQMFTITQYLISKGFDLFGLIEAGLAIDKTILTVKL